MEQLNAFQITVISASLLVISVNMVNGQISTPCTTSMISSFTPCANFITGSTNNRATSSTTCCDSLRSLMSTSMDCACLVVSANVPFQLPINRALALSLPQACNMNGLPVQCKATGSPLPAPGPSSLGPNATTPPPAAAASPISPQASKATAVAEAPKPDTLRVAAAAASPPVQAKAKRPRKLQEFNHL